MKTVKFHREAESEMIEAAEYYESMQKNLGKRFLESVRNLIHLIQINPGIFKTVHPDFHLAKTSIFPYGIIYREKDEYLEVIAVMHLKRKPGYWKNRSE